MKKRICIGLFGIFVLAFIGCRETDDESASAKEENLEKGTSFMMGTYVTIYAAGPKETASRAIDLAFARMREVDEKFNPANAKSPLHAFNNKGVPISDEEVLLVVRKALEVGRESGGAFDITVFPLTLLWGFDTENPHLPSEPQIKEGLKRVGYEHLLLGDEKLEKDMEGTAINLGGIAKGYAVGQAVEVLKAEGVTSALIDAGGDVYALGSKKGAPWKVGIRKPRGEGLLGYLEVKDTAVMGSGDYERFFMKDGRRYHHILDPATGYPAEGLAAVFVIYPDPMMADAWATALFVTGPEKGLEIVEKIPGMEIIMVTTSGEKLYSSGLRNALKVVPKDR